MNSRLSIASATLAVVTLLLSVSAGCSAPEGDHEVAESSEGAYGTCPTNAHECSIWGATCNGAVLETCVVDTRGCRVKLVAACDLGCNAGACNTCRTVSEPKQGSSLSDESAFYRDVTKQGSFVFAAWNQRNGIYSGSGYGIAVIDVSIPATPTTRKIVTAATGDYVTGLTSQGNRLFALQKERVQIYDITTPIAPVALGSYAATATPGSWPAFAVQREVSVDGTIMCIGADDGLHIVDVSNPSAPVRRSLFATPAFRPSHVACSGGYAAIVSDTSMRIVDIKNPAAPFLAAEGTLGGHVYDFDGDVLRFDGARVVVASRVHRYDTSTGLLETFDFVPPPAGSAAATLGSVTRATGTGDLPVIDGFELTATELFFRTSTSVGSLDLADPTTAKLRKHVIIPDGVQGLAREGSVLLASGKSGITAVDLTIAPDVVIEPVNDWLSDVATSGSIAYMARQKGGFVISDVRDPKKPVVLSTTRVHATSVALRGHRAYVTVADNGASGGGDELRVYDVASPWEPALLATYVQHRSYAHTRTIDDVHVTTGGRAYAICDGGLLCTFDIQSSVTPALLAKPNLSTYAAYQNRSAFEASGTTVYLAKPDALTVVDLADPLVPVVKGTVTLGGYAGAGSENTRIALAGTTAFVLYDCFYTPGSAGNRCLDVIDVSNASAPVVIGHTRFSARYQNVDGWDHDTIGTFRLAADRLYLTTRAGGVVVIDVASPSQPKVLARLWTSRFANEVFVTGRFANTNAGQPYNAYGSQGRTQVIEMCKP